MNTAVLLFLVCSIGLTDVCQAKHLRNSKEDRALPCVDEDKIKSIEMLLCKIGGALTDIMDVLGSNAAACSPPIIIPPIITQSTITLPTVTIPIVTSPTITTPSTTPPTVTPSTITPPTNTTPTSTPTPIPCNETVTDKTDEKKRSHYSLKTKSKETKKHHKGKKHSKHSKSQHHQ